MISVIIPVYNREKTIEKAIKSVLNQTYQDLEVIVVDDKSTDNTESIVSKIVDKRLRYITLDKNMGACAARNRGITEAQGDFIAFQDSDDEWCLDKLEKQMKCLNTNKADFVFCGMRRYKQGSTSSYVYYPAQKVDIEGDMYKQVLFENCIGTVTILCKRGCFEHMGFDETLRRFQDWDLALQASKVFKLGFVDEALVNSYIQSDSISSINKGLELAWQAIYIKYEQDILQDPQINAKYMERLGDAYRNVSRSKSINFYLESIKNKVNVKVLIKLTMVFSGCKKLIDMYIESRLQA